MDVVLKKSVSVGDKKGNYELECIYDVYANKEIKRIVVRFVLCELHGYPMLMAVRHFKELS